MPMRFDQKQLILPLLEAAEKAGGQIRTQEAYDVVAEHIAISPEQRASRRAIGTRQTNVFEHAVRWAQQKARLSGLMERIGPQHWTLTGTGRKALRAARPGLVITIFTTDRGAALWGSCSDAAALINDGSVALIMTSPPYPLLSQKAYGNQAEKSYVDWLLAEIEKWPRILSKHGSLVLNLGDAWRPGAPHLSTYQERLLVRLEDDLGFRLCQRFAWHNPSKMPVPAEWVTVRKVRVKPSIEQIFWLSQADHPYADNRQVLEPYSASMIRRIQQGGETTRTTRPSGYELRPGAFASDNGGAIPGNLIIASNTASRGAYQDGCRLEDLPIHPARFPEAIPEFFIKMLTRNNDLVFDPFGGSSTTGAVAEKLGRNWITSDQALDYVLGARHRFPSHETAL